MRIVSADPTLPAATRHQALDLGPLAATNPDLALTRLQELRDTFVPGLPLVVPIVDYARCVNIEIYWRWNLDPIAKAFISTAEDYRRIVEADAVPEVRLWNDLGPDPLVPAANSWLLPVAGIAGLSGAETKVRLNMAQDPPYVVFVFSVARMHAAGIGVRIPCGLDAVPSRLLQWYPENVPSERIDSDLVRNAVERIEWRP